jgi:hypothetical protein
MKKQTNIFFERLVLRKNIIKEKRKSRLPWSCPRLVDFDFVQSLYICRYGGRPDPEQMQYHGGSSALRDPRQEHDAEQF